VTFTAQPLHDRPRPADQMDRLFAGGWPEFIFHDQDTERYIGSVYSGRMVSSFTSAGTGIGGPPDEAPCEQGGQHFLVCGAEFQS
jgi:hypothetical protein